MNDCEEIVTHFAYPTLVLAGPGAGKTYLLVPYMRDGQICGTSVYKLTW